MINYNLDTTITADELLKVIEAGSGITLTKIDCCTLRISSTGGASNGLKYHLKAGDNITVEECFEYCICGDFIVDDGAMFNIEAGGILEVGGMIVNQGIICNEGIIINN